jgi:ABC-2 type transport system permease protein
VLTGVVEEKSTRVVEVLLARMPPGSCWPAMVAWLLIWFVAGFALWSVIYGALGALASRSEDAQTVSAPATIVLLGGYLFAMFAALSDPDALTTRIASFIPVTAPLVMPIRLARGQIAPRETTLALLLTIAATYALVRLVGRVYAGALLHTGGKMRLRDGWRVGGTEIPSARREPVRT